MAKTYLSHAKYIIHQNFEIKGVVDKHDIIGAIFGQSEGIIGEDLDIRELQSSGKIGRIEIDLKSEKGITKGTLTIPSGSDMVETSILAATIEVVDKVGPCDAKFETVKIEDTRVTKRKVIVERAKQLLSKLIMEEIPDSQEIANEVKAEVRAAELTEYGPDKLPAGPNINESEEVIVVEGRADVINLLKYNIKNVIAMGGSRIPPTIVDLSKKKTIIAFVDGDRGGELDLKRLLQIAQIDYIAKAPPGKEVEELTKKEILASLNKKIPVIQTKTGGHIPTDEDIEIDLGPEKYWEAPTETDEEILDAILEEPVKPHKHHKPHHEEHHKEHPVPKREHKKPEPKKEPKKKEEKQKKKPQPKKEEKIEIPKDMFVDYPKEMKSLKNTLKARFYDKKGKQTDEVAVRELLKKLKEKKEANTIIFDGIITKRLAELAKSRGVKYLVGAKKGKMSKIKGIELIEFEA